MFSGRSTSLFAQISFMRPNNVASLQYPVSTAFSLYTNSNLSVIAISCVHRMYVACVCPPLPPPCESELMPTTEQVPLYDPSFTLVLYSVAWGKFFGRGKESGIYLEHISGVAD